MGSGSFVFGHRSSRIAAGGSAGAIRCSEQPARWTTRPPACRDERVSPTPARKRSASRPARQEPAPRTTIAVQGARVHNLKNVSLEIPRDKLIVVTGLSGSGKSSLAFDTIYAEGQRRYMESLSTYAKRFIAQVAKPDVDFVYGLSDRKSTRLNSSHMSISYAVFC